LKPLATRAELDAGDHSRFRNYAPVDASEVPAGLPWEPCPISAICEYARDPAEPDEVQRRWKRITYATSVVAHLRREDPKPKQGRLL